MRENISKHQAVISLHERGYTHDFHLFGNDLFWTQGKLLIRAGDFNIIEYYRFLDRDANNSETVVFAVIAYSYNVKGILMIHSDNGISNAAPVIRKKLNDFKIRSNDRAPEKKLQYL